MTESVNLTVANNQKSVAGVMSHVPTMVGGGFGFKGALKGVAMATTFNAVTQGISNAAIKNARNITPPQQAELYGRIKADILLKRVFLDYWNVYISLVCTLKIAEVIFGGRQEMLTNSIKIFFKIYQIRIFHRIRF